MMSVPTTIRAALAASTVLWLADSPLQAQENYDGWAILQNPFESTGGGGIMIDRYAPVVVGNKCTTDFTATVPDGKVYYNTIEFEAVPAQGGILCTNGAWRATDGSMSGTTPFRVFIKDGVVRRSP
jgi:hypothetical protein